MARNFASAVPFGSSVYKFADMLDGCNLLPHNY
jgi:hypothetical protein